MKAMCKSSLGSESNVDRRETDKALLPKLNADLLASACWKETKTIRTEDDFNEAIHPV